MNSINFDKEYNKFIDYLYSFQDIKYREFHSKLIMDDNLIGIRMPILKKIAKDISKKDYESFLKNNKCKIYEEKVIYGLVLGYLKIDFKKLLALIDSFIPYIDNWAINDSLCANLKIFKNNLEEGYIFISKCLNSSNPFEKRVGLVLLLNYYINDQYIDKILDKCMKIDNSNYYVSMATAWLLSMCYIKYPDRVYKFIRNNKIDKLTKNRTIQKIIDSKRIDINSKNKIKKLR